jgi:FkbM family methyltransferase
MSILHRGFVKRYLARRGMSLVQEPGLWDFLDTRRVDLVIDVGANAGQFARDVRSLGYRGRIHSFEPLRAAFAELQGFAAGDPLWEASNVGVGGKAGKLEINVAKNSVFSSFRALSDLAGRFDPNSQTVETLRVPVVTLDNALGGDNARSIFLKIDTQGFEQEVLAGAKKLLKRCAGVQLELPVDHLYEGVWSFNEALTAMDSYGFVPAQFRAVNPRAGDRAAAVEFDAIFRRKD